MHTAWSFILGFLGIGLMVLVHETGHFIAARMCGIEVEVFAIGWGKSIKRWRKGKTEFALNLFPLGGYCRLKGAKDLEKALRSSDGSYGELEQGSLFKAAPLKRIATYVAGPLANMLAAVVLLSVFHAIGYRAQVDQNVVALTTDYPRLFSTDQPVVSAAAEAGLTSGDRIVSVDGISTPDFQRLQEVLADRKADRTALFSIERNGVAFELAIMPQYDSAGRRSLFGVTAYVEPVVASVAPLSSEAAAGLQSGDRIITVQGKSVVNTLDVAMALIDDPSLITLEVKRPGIDSVLTIAFSPARDESGTAMLQFGIRRYESWRDGKALNEAFKQASKDAVSLVVQTFTAIPALVTGVLDVDDVLAGPLRISYLVGDLANTGLKAGFREGLRSICWILGLVGVSLGAANLLPIPALDGGFIVMGLVELVRGKRLRPHTYARLQNLGAIVIILIFLVAIIGDFKYFL